MKDQNIKGKVNNNNINVRFLVSYDPSGGPEGLKDKKGAVYIE